MRDDRNRIITCRKDYRYIAMIELIKQEEAMKIYTEAVRTRKKYSNCYFSPNEFCHKLGKKKITVYKGEDALLLVEKGERTNSLYYMSDSYNWVCSLENIKASHKPLVLNLVQKEESAEKLPFLDYGYSVHKVYQRLRKMGRLPDCKENTVSDYCGEEDRGRLRDMMDNTFDVFSDNIPTEEELNEFIKNKNIICIRMEHRVIGFIIFEDKGKTSYIRMVCIDRDYRGKGLGNKLMNIYFRLHSDYKSFTLWYDTENMAAYSLYLRWGYEKESMYNFIFVF